ncbi:DUF4209 domain-containing protein [Aeromonas caviae]
MKDSPTFVQEHDDSKKIITNIDEPSYEQLWLAFSKAALEANNISQCKEFWLLAHACAMDLNPHDKHNPFSSSTTYYGWKSYEPVDFQDQDLEFFSLAINEINNHWLKARLADLLWIRRYKDGHRMAMTAIHSYRQIPISRDVFHIDWQSCWRRAINLSQILGKPAAKELVGIKQDLQNDLLKITKSESSLALKLSELLLTTDSKPAKNQAILVAKKLESLAKGYDNDTDQVQIMIAGMLFRSAKRWFDIANDTALAAAMTAQVTECYFREGNSRIQPPHPSYGAAASFYEQAIKCYRTIPGSHRQALGAEERIIDLRHLMDDASKKSLGELGQVPWPEIDFREQMEWASQAVQGKALGEALQTFSCITLPPFKYQNLRQQVIERLKQPSIIDIHSVVIRAENGRVISKVPSIDSDAEVTDEKAENRLFFEMTKTYRSWLYFYVTAFIWPALNSLIADHSLQEKDIIEIANNSPIVPQGREISFGKALFSGFNNDFVTAIYLLAPQIEHLVRYHLNQAGVDTTYLDQDTGIQNEYGLGSIIEFPEVKSIFGEDLFFEIKALYCSSVGPNLRNIVAHGLLDDDDCQSIEVIYSWWLGFRLVCNLAKTL